MTELERLQKENRKLQVDVVYWREANDDARLELRNLRDQTRWRSVEEELPEIGKRILLDNLEIADRINESEIYIDGHGGMPISHFKKTFDYYYIIQPLPEPPESEVDDLLVDDILNVYDALIKYGMKDPVFSDEVIQYLTVERNKIATAVGKVSE